MWYSLEDGNDYALDRTESLEEAKQKAAESWLVVSGQSNHK